MESQNQRAMTGQGAVLSELEPSQLAEITGGTFWVSDGYCVSPLRLPRPLPGPVVQQQIVIAL
jgi:hypothetical protein